MSGKLIPTVKFSSVTSTKIKFSNLKDYKSNQKKTVLLSLKIRYDVKKAQADGKIKVLSDTAMN